LTGGWEVCRRMAAGEARFCFWGWVWSCDLSKNDYLCMVNSQQMDNPRLDIDKVVGHWMETSDGDFNTMLVLFDAKSYHWALFMGHIAIEKLLKAYIVKQTGSHAPHTHNLYRLAEYGSLEISEEYADWLFKITTFNLNARYDDYKKEFYAICTVAFAKEWIEKIKTLQQWIKQML